MRLRSEPTVTVGLGPNVRMDQSGRPGRGGRFNVKLPKFLGGHRAQPVVSNTSTTDGHELPRGEEPRNVIHKFEQICEEQHFCEASRMLIEREKCLFRGEKEAEALKGHEEEVKKLAEDYRDLEDSVMQTLERSLCRGEVCMEALKSAVKAITQETDQDQQWEKRKQTAPDWRPRDWQKLHDATLRSVVRKRMDNPSMPLAHQAGQSSIKADVHSMGRQLKDDLLFVVEELKSCYPPELDICNFYAKLYHQQHSSRLRKIVEFGLDDQDNTFLLLWVNSLYPELLQKPQLTSEIDGEALGKLLPEEMLKPLEEQHLSKRQDEVMTFISRVLEDAKGKYDKGENPTTEENCFVSPVAFDIITIINDLVSAAGKIVGDQQMAQTITSQLKDLMERFRTFHNDIIKQNKPNSRPFIKAHLGCIEEFSDCLNKKTHLFPEDVRKSCLQILPDMKQTAHAYLLKPVHEALKPQYRKLGTNEWLNKPLFEKLLDSIEHEVQDLNGSRESCHQELISKLHQEVTAEYVRRLLKGEVKLKDQERQLKAYTTVKDDAESLHALFISMGSKEDWLKEEILITIAEVLKLQDLPAIQMQVASLGMKFPDLTVKHVSALLKLKTNFSKANRKTVKDTLTETLMEASSVDARSFFSTVQVR